ncbi:MAG: hypothetical protein SFY69_02610 [Planctomycetota bacterium]|nr:hypothetical protein [Planctomycetota bacterium]
MKFAVAFCAGLALASAASAQTSELRNPGFEFPCGICNNAPFAEGWASPGNSTLARRRWIGDGQTPEFFPVGTPNALTPRTGESVISISTTGSGFYGVTTDSVNFCACRPECQTCDLVCALQPAPCSTAPFYDPVWDINGGDVVVTGWYMIPENDPIVNDLAGIKLNIKTLNQDVATLDLNEGPGGIQGHTNGQWTLYTVVFSRDEIINEYECNTGARPDCGCGCVPASPLPNRVKIVIGRFNYTENPGQTPGSGTIYWDDIVYTQLPRVTPCDPDFNQDGNVDQDDIACLAQVVAGDPACSAVDPDFNRDGNVDQDDIAALEQVVAGAPCP